MRALAADALFDHALLMDAFGFFETEKEDLAALAAVRKVLGPQGTALLKVINGEYVRNNLQVVDERELNGTLERTRRELLGDRLHEHITLTSEQGSTTTERWQRLYGAERLLELAQSADFGVALTASDAWGGTRPA